MIIRLRDIELKAYHGVLAEEKANGNLFRVSVSIETEEQPGCTTDRIEDTLNYKDIYDIVCREMSIASDLLEHVAWRIRRALRGAYPDARHITVSVSKQNPPVGGPVAWGEVETGD